MPVPDADPQAAELDDAFSKAMDGPAKPREPGPPPEVDNDAPFGREDDGSPKAPYGFNKDGKVRRTAAGRRAKDDDGRARTGPPEPKDTKAAPGPPPAGRDASYYEKGLDEVAGQLWLLVGFVSPADAGALDTCSDALVKAWAKGAEQDATVRRAVDWLCSETWVTGVAMATIPLATMVLANHGRLPERLMPKISQAAQRERLAAMTEEKRAAVFAQMAGAVPEDQAENDPQAA